MAAVVVVVVRTVVVDWLEQMQGPSSVQGHMPTGRAEHAIAQAASVAPNSSAASAATQSKLLPVLVEMLEVLVEEDASGVVVSAAVVVSVTC